MDEETVLRRKPRIPWQRLDDDTIVVDPSARRVHMLNETASFVWGMLEDFTTVKDVIAAACLHFDVSPSIAREEILCLLLRMRQEGLLEIRDGSGET